MILIVGGAGYLGSVIAQMLGRKATVYDSLLYNNEYILGTGFAQGDVRYNWETLKYGLDRASCVIWLAAIVGDAACMIDPSEAIAVNQESVKWLTENYDGPIIFTSTCSVYGANDQIVDESAPLRPQSLYAETKVNAERYLQNKQALILRLGTLYGLSPRMRFDLVVNIMALNAATIGQIEVFGGAQYRPLISVVDTARLIVNAATNPSWQHGVYNLAAHNMRVDDIAKEVISGWGGVTIKSRALATEDKRSYRVDSSRVYEEFDFSPTEKIGHTSLLIASLIYRIRNLKDPRYYNAATLRKR